MPPPPHRAFLLKLSPPLRDPYLMLKNNTKASMNKLLFLFFFTSTINYLNYFTARERDKVIFIRYFFKPFLKLFLFFG